MKLLKLRKISLFELLNSVKIRIENFNKATESLAHLGTFDMDNFMTTMEKLFNFSHEQSGHIFNLIDLADSYFNYLHTQMEQQYYIETLQ